MQFVWKLPRNVLWLAVGFLGFWLAISVALEAG
jgi:hypothetical protein